MRQVFDIMPGIPDALKCSCGGYLMLREDMPVVPDCGDGMVTCWICGLAYDLLLLKAMERMKDGTVIAPGGSEKH